MNDGLEMPFCYGTASNELRGEFDKKIAVAIGAEMASGNSFDSTLAVEHLIVASRAGDVRVWVDGIRAKIRDMLSAERWITANPSKEIEKELEQATHAATKTEQELLQAQGRHAAAVSIHSQAAERKRLLEQAQATLTAIEDTLVAAAWRSYKVSASKK